MKTISTKEQNYGQESASKHQPKPCPRVGESTVLKEVMMFKKKAAEHSQSIKALLKEMEQTFSKLKRVHKDLEIEVDKTQADAKKDKKKNDKGASKTGSHKMTAKTNDTAKSDTHQNKPLDSKDIANVAFIEKDPTKKGFPKDVPKKAEVHKSAGENHDFHFDAHKQLDLPKPADVKQHIFKDFPREVEGLKSADSKLDPAETPLKLIQRLKPADAKVGLNEDVPKNAELPKPADDKK